MEQNRFKSKIFWIAVAGWIITGVQLLGGFEKLGIDAGATQDIIVVLINMAWNIFAAYNNPTNPNGL